MPTPRFQVPVNRFKRELLALRPQIGLWSSLASNLSVEIIAGAGFDWILLDTEHAPNEPPMVLSQLHAAAEGTASAVVRVAWNDAVMIKKQLDIGVQSFLVPMVQNADDARRAVAATRYPRLGGGTRGYASLSRANRFGRIPDYFRTAHEQICVLVQVETRAALKEIEAIAAVPGVDGMFIGPGDLSSDMGRLGEPSHPEVQAAIGDAISRIRSAGKAPGILAPVEIEAKKWLAAGAVFVAVGSDIGILARQS
jgi:4-hydroxy-2-oxoheptanedioate aldolase